MKTIKLLVFFLLVNNISYSQNPLGTFIVISVRGEIKAKRADKLLKPGEFVWVGIEEFVFKKQTLGLL